MDDRFRCIYCGRFVGLEEEELGLLHCDITPDSDLSTECIDWYHKECKRKSELKHE
jgi:hypothetical protein